jgi:transposase
MWIIKPPEASLLQHFTTFVIPMQEVATHTDYKALYEESQLVITQLRHEPDQLKKMIFGSRQERFTRVESFPANPVTTHQGRMKLPDHLEIGRDITEELEYEPGKRYVNRFIRPKYASADNQTILMAPLPERLLPKAIAGSGLLAQIIIDKYVDHLPLHRQQQRFSREKINIPYSTLTDWVGNTCTLIAPLYAALKKKVLEMISAYPINRIQELLPHNQRT